MTPDSSMTHHRPERLAADLAGSYEPDARLDEGPVDRTADSTGRHYLVAAASDSPPIQPLPNSWTAGKAAYEAARKVTHLRKVGREGKPSTLRGQGI
jgi:hypothetical protein